MPISSIFRRQRVPVLYETSSSTPLRRWLWPLLTGVLCAAATLAIHRWPPPTIVWPVGVGLHHATVFAALYLLLRWRYEPALAFSAALGISVAPLAVTGAPLGQYTLAAIGEFGLLTSFALILLVLADYRWRRRLTPLFPAWFWGVASLAGVVSLFPAFGQAALFPYFLGPNASWLAQAMAIVALLLALQRHYTAAILVVLVSVGYDMRVLSSHNAWHYAAEWTWPVALLPVLVHRWRQKNAP